MFIVGGLGKKLTLRNLAFSSQRASREEIKMGFWSTLVSKDMGANLIYSSNALIMGRNKIKDFSWIRDRVVSKLEGSNKNLLSKIGKAVFIQSIIQAIPFYTMATFKVPTTLCKELDRLVKKFWWSSGTKVANLWSLSLGMIFANPKEKGVWGFVGFQT